MRTVSREPIAPAGHQVLPVSPVQMAMLFETLRRPQIGFYLQQFRIRLRREIDAEIMRRTWDFLANRHDSLRSSFLFDARNVPVMHVAPSVSVPFRTEDWSERSPREQRRQMTAFLRADRSHGFALNTPPLMRVALIRLGERDHELVWTSHHVLFDGRSRYLILHELPEIYEALAAGREPRLPEATSCAGFARWIADADFSDAESFWRQAMDGVAEPVHLEIGSPGRRRADEPAVRCRYATRFSKAVLDRLERFCAESQLTLNTLMQAAWAVVLSRYSGKDDVVFGAPRAGRHAPVEGLDGTVGVFVNTLPVRAKVSDDRPVLEFLRELRENWIAMRPHEQTPLREIHRWSGTTEGRELFDTLVGYERFQIAEELAAASPWWRDATIVLDGWTTFALTIQAYRGDGLELVLSYDPVRFTAAAIRRLGGHLRTVLTGLVSAEARTLGDLLLLAPAESRALAAWRETAAKFPSRRDVGSVFSRVARRFAAQTALVLGEQTLSYEELDKASDAVAAWLCREGVREGTRVGVLLGRSFEQVEAILGVLKAGAAYVPLDRDYPRERLRFMIADAGLELILGDAATRATLGDDLTTRVEDVAQIRERGQEFVGSHQRAAANPEAPAYIMYTSGSTGVPKGVIVPHRGILRLVFGVEYAAFGPEHTFLQMAPVSFDASTFELWGALLHGARCVLYPDARPEIGELGRQIASHNVDTLWLTAALFNLVIDEAPDILRPVRQLLTGGEALSPAHVAKALRELPDTTLINGYGPTETTTFACCHPIARAGFDPGASVPIGRPIGNTTCHVLDRAGRPVPVGVEGELYIGGAGVALGYLNRPELTRDRFVHDRFSAGEGKRLLYRTGDLVAWREDGLLEFRGRVDDQIKIRGFRIEPGEIAHVIQSHPRVKQAAVLAVDAPTSGKKLAAFYTTESDAPVGAAELQAFLSERLPAYMVPASFAELEKIPVTANGKVDRAALLQAAARSEKATKQNSEPATETERKLRALWSEILGVGAVSVNDSFFALGGSSLAVIRLVHHIRQQFDVELPIHAFFENPTLASQLALLQQGKRAAAGPSIATFRAAERGERWLVDVGRAKYVEFCFLPENLRRRFVMRAFRFSGALDVPCLVRAIRFVTRRHEALSTRYVVEAPGRVFQVRSRGECPVETISVADLPENQRGDESERLFLDMCDEPADPAAEWLHRFRLVVLSPVDHLLVCCFHHLNFDGPSLNVFYRDVSESYRAFAAGGSPDLSAAPPQENDLYNWLEAWQDPESLSASREFWRTTLADAPLIELPVAPDAADHRNDSGCIERIIVEKAAVDRLRALAREQRATLYEVFLAGFNTVMSRVGRNDDVTAAINVDQRMHQSLEDVIGCFGKRLLIRTKLGGDPRFSEVVARTSAQMREALAHRHLPIEEIRKFCGAPDPFTNAIDRVFFIQSPERSELLNLAGVTWTSVPRRRHQPLGLVDMLMREAGGPVELLASHIPGVIPTETVRAMLRLFAHIMTEVASGRDPRVSELPRLGEPLVATSPAGASTEDAVLKEKILEIFRDVLRAPHAGPLDSFFHLGGDSLSALRLLRHIQQNLGREIAYQTLLENPTVDAVVRVLQRAESADAPSLAEFRRVERPERWPVTRNVARRIERWFKPENLRRRNIARAFRLDGKLDLENLVRAIRWVVGRHEALSTRYVVETSGEVFMERSRGICPVEVHDFSSLPEAGRWSEVQRAFAEEGNRAFDPHAAWMHRFLVFVLSPQDHVLVVNFNHLSFDGRSLNTFYRELAESYRAFLAGEDPKLPAVAAQQTDVCEWLAEWLTPIREARLRSDARKALAGAPVAKLPIVENREGSRNGKGHIESLVLDAKTTAALKGLARRSDVTLYQLLLAGLFALIQRVGGTEDLCVGIGVDLRTHESLNGVVGDFSNLVMVRAQLGGDPRFSEIVARVVAQVREALARGYLPHDEVVRDHQSKDIFENPINRVRFIKSPERSDPLRLPGLTCSPIQRENHAPVGILPVFMLEFADVVELRVPHIPAVIPSENVRAMLQLFASLLSTIASGDDPRLSELPRYSAASELKPPHDSRRDHREIEECLLEIFRDVLGNPNAGPLDSLFELGGHSLVAAKLIHRAEQRLGLDIPFHALFAHPTARALAASLMSAPDSNAQPFIETFRSENRGARWQLGPGQTGIVEPCFRPENLARRSIVRELRLRGQLDTDALVRALRAVARRHESLSTHFVVESPGRVFQVRNSGECPVEIVDLSGLPEEQRWSEVRRIVADEEVRDFDPAAEWMHAFRLLIIAPRECVLLLNFHHASFDGTSLSTFYRELTAHYRAFAAGEKLHLSANVPQATDVHDWIDRWLNAERVAVSRNFWRTALDGLPPLDLPLARDHQHHRNDVGRVEYLNVSAAVIETLNRRARSLGVTLFQLFLASFEAVINRVGKNDDVAVGIGVNLRTHESLEDAIGCLVTRLTIRTKLGGDPTFSELVGRVASGMEGALAHRYLPLSEIRSVLDSDEAFENIGALRFTHSGECGGLPNLPDIECTEIPREKHLPMGLLAVVMRETDGGVELRASHIPGVLPTETVRAILRLYSDLLERVAAGDDPRLSELPRLGVSAALEGGAAVDRHSPQRTILDIFRDVLNKPDLGAHDSFFQAGGDSLAAIRLAHRIHEAHGVELPGDALFENPTAAGLEQWLHCSRAIPSAAPRGTISRKDRGERWPVGEKRARQVRHDFLPQHLRDRNIVRAFRLRGALDVTILVQAIRHVVARHEALSTHYVVEADGSVFQVRSRGTCPVDIVNLAWIPESDRDAAIRKLVADETSRPLDPSQQWMPRFRVLVLGEHEHVLLLNFHHLNFDGTSLNRFYSDLSKCFHAFRTGTPVALPTEIPQMSDVLEWQEQFLTATRLAASTEYWRRAVTGAALLDLPLARDYEKHRHDAGRSEVLKFQSHTVQRLREIAGARRVTLYQLFLAGFVALMNRVGDNTDVAIGIGADLRDDESQLHAIGNFVNRVMVRTSLVGDPSLSEVVARVAARMHEALAHRHFSCAKVRELYGSSDDYQNPVDRVRFLHNPEQDDALSLDGIESSAIPRENSQPTGIFPVYMRELSDGVELRAAHIPTVLPTENVRAMLRLFEDIMTVMASGADARLSELPRLQKARPESAVETGRNGDDVEQRVLAIFRDVLENPDVGPHDSLFDHGGHSLVAARLLHRLEKSFGRSLSHAVLYENPTARGLAAALAQTRETLPAPLPAALTRRPRDRRERANLFTRYEFRYLRDAVPRTITRAFLLRGRVDAEVLEQALQWVVDRHDALRTRLFEESGEIFREVRPARVHLETITCPAKTPDERADWIESLIAKEANRIFTADSFPLEVFTLAKLDDEEHVLVLNFSHALFDGKSLVVFLRELSVACAAFARGKTPELPEPKFQLNDVMGWIDQWHEGGGFRVLDDYWREKLRGMRHVRLPVDQDPETAAGKPGEFFHRPIPDEVTARARKTAAALGTTMYGLNHAVLNAMLWSFGCRGEIPVGIVSCMRRHPDAEGTIGNFANLVVASTSVDGNPTFRELSARTRREAQEVLAHRGLPYAQMLTHATPVEPFRQWPFPIYLIEESATHFTLPGVECRPILRRLLTPSVPIAFQITSDSSTMTVRCMARPDFFSRQRCLQLLEHYELYFRLAADEPDRRLNDFPPFSPSA